jgi:hypothetical protein
MQPRLKLIIAILLSGLSVFSVFNPTGTPHAMQPARPGHFAELEELEAARKAGKVAAYDLFLARHPTSRYAATAKTERSKLMKQ